MFSNRTCSNNDTFLGGVQIGDAFQYDRLVWAVEADFDAWSGKKYNRSLQYAGNTSPQGTYLFPANQSKWFRHLSVRGLATPAIIGCLTSGAVR